MRTKTQDNAVPQPVPGIRHAVVGPFRNTSQAISAIAQFADDDPSGEAVIMRKSDFDQLVASR
jgi:hypothetical protein